MFCSCPFSRGLCCRLIPGAGAESACAAHSRTELEVWSAPLMIRQRRGARSSQTLPFPWGLLATAFPEFQCQGLESPDQNLHLLRSGGLPLTKRCVILHVLFWSLEGCSASCSDPWAPCEPPREEDAHTQLGLIPRVGLCRLSQDLLPEVSEG